MDFEINEKLKKGVTLGDSDLMQFYQEFHQSNAGFTEELIDHCDTSFNATSYKVLADLIPPAFQGTILDIACGSGKLTELCLPRMGENAQISAFDLSLDELALARSRIEDSRVSFIRGNSSELPFEDQSMDLIFCHLALMLFHPLDQTILEIWRTLKPSGTFAAVIHGEPGESLIYDQFCDLVLGFVKKGFPSLPPNGLGNELLNPQVQIKDLMSSTLNEDCNLNLKKFSIQFSGSTKSISQRLIRYFYISYLLPQESLDELLIQTMALLDEKTLLMIPHRLLTIEK